MREQHNKKNQTIDREAYNEQTASFVSASEHPWQIYHVDEEGRNVWALCTGVGNPLDSAQRPTLYLVKPDEEGHAWAVIAEISLVIEWQHGCPSLALDMNVTLNDQYPSVEAAMQRAEHGYLDEIGQG